MMCYHLRLIWHVVGAALCTEKLLQHGVDVIIHAADGGAVSGMQ